MSQEKRTKINGLDSSSHSKRNKNKIPNNKTIDYTTTHYKYYNGKHRKFNEEEFQKHARSAFRAGLAPAAQACQDGKKDYAQNVVDNRGAQKGGSGLCLKLS